MNRLILNQGSTFSVGANSSDTTIVGTSAGSEVITIGLGAKVVFDASFNKGGDVINLAGNASSYTAKQVGSSIVLTDSLGSSITIPVGIVGANISFADAAPRKLVYDTISRSIKLGNDVVDTTPDALSVGEAGPPAPAQTFNLTKSTDAVDEDGSVLFTLATTGVAAGTEYTYTLSGVSAHDIVGGALTGTAKIGADGKAVIQVNLAEDGRTEGTETLTLSVAGKSGAVVINDTSKAASTVTPTYVLKASSATVDEGGTAVFTLETTNVAAGSQFNYLITGVNSADVSGGQMTGVATVGADGKALISVNLVADAKTEGLETLVVGVAGQSASVDVNDTSAAAAEQTSFTVSAADIAAANAQSVPVTVNVGNTGTRTVTIQSDGASPAQGVIINGDANTTITSGASGDTLVVSGNGDNSISTGAGADNVTIYGSGNNTINVGTGNDTVVSSAGNDLVIVGSGDLKAGDSINTGLGSDTVRISGDGNVIRYDANGDGDVLDAGEFDGATLIGVENIVLDGTTLQISDNTLASLVAAGLVNISGHADTSVITIKASAGDVIDLSGLSLSALKTIKVDAGGAATLKLTDAQIAQVGSIGEQAGTVLTVDTSVAGYQALGTKAPGVDVVVTDNVTNLLNAGNSISGVTAQLGNATVAEATRVIESGLTATYKLVDSAANLAAAPKAVFAPARATAIEATTVATAAQAAAIQSLVTAMNFDVDGNANAAVLVKYEVSDTADMLTTFTSGLGNAIKVTATTVANIEQASTIYNAAGVAAAPGSLATTVVYEVKDTATLLQTAVGDAGKLAALNAASSVTIKGDASVDQVKAINNALLGADGGLTKVVAGYSLVDEYTAGGANNDLTDSSAITSAAGNVTASGTALTAAEALQIEALTNTGSNSYALTGDVAILLGASSAVRANASTVNVTEGSISATQANSLATSYTAAQLTGDTIAVSGTIAQLNTLTSAALAFVDSLTLSTTAVKVEDLLTLFNKLTDLGMANKMPAYSVLDTAANLEGSIGNAAKMAILEAATAVSIDGVAKVSQVKAINTALALDSGTPNAVTTYALKDTAAALASSNAADRDIINLASAVTIDGKASVAQITAINATMALSGGITGTVRGYTLEDTAAALTVVNNANTAGDLATTAIDKAATVIVKDDATVAQINTIASRYTETDGDAVLGTDIQYSIADRVSALTTATSLAAATIVTVKDTADALIGPDGILVRGYTTVDRIVVEDDLTDLSNTEKFTTALKSDAKLQGIVITDTDLDVGDATQVNALADLGKPLTYSVVDSYTDLTTYADADVKAAVEKLIAGAQVVTVDSNTGVTGVDTIDVASFNKLDGLTAGKIVANLSDTFAKLAATNAEKAISDVKAEGKAVSIDAASIDAGSFATVDQVNTLVSRGVALISGGKYLDVSDTAENIAKLTDASYAALANAGSTITVNDNGLVTLTVDQATKIFDNAATNGSSYGNYILRDTAENLAALLDGASPDNVALFQLAKGVIVTGTEATVAQAILLNSKETMGSVSYAVKSNAAAIEAALTTGSDAEKAAARAALNAASSITVTGTATVDQAELIYSLTPSKTYSISDTAANISGVAGGTGFTSATVQSNVLNKATNVTVASGDLSVANANIVLGASNSGTTSIFKVIDAADKIATLALGAGENILTIEANTAAKVSEAEKLVALADTNTSVIYNLTDSATALAGADASVLNSAGTITANTAATAVEAAKISAATVSAGNTAFDIDDSATAIAALDIAVLNDAVKIKASPAATVAEAIKLNAASASNADTAFDIKDNIANLIANSDPAAKVRLASDDLVILNADALSGLTSGAGGLVQYHEAQSFAAAEVAAATAGHTKAILAIAVNGGTAVAVYYDGDTSGGAAELLVVLDGKTLADVSAANFVLTNGPLDNAAVIADAGKVTVEGALTLQQAIELRSISGAPTYVYDLVDNDAAIVNAAGTADGKAALLGATSVVGSQGTALSFANVGDTPVFGITGTKAQLDALSTELATLNRIYSVSVADLVANASFYSMLSGSQFITVTDNADNLLSGNALLALARKITVTGEVSAQQATQISALSALDTVSYTIRDTAAALSGIAGAVLNNATMIFAKTDATVAEAVNIVGASATAANTKFSITDTASDIASAASAVRDGAINITATGTANFTEAATLLGATNTGSTTIAAASMNAAQAKALTYNATGDDKITALTVTGNTDVTQATEIVGDVTAGDVGTVEFDLVDDKVGLATASTAVLNAAKTITASGAVGVVLAAKLDLATPSDASTTYSIADTAEAILAADPALLARGNGNNNTVTVTDTSVSAATAKKLIDRDALYNGVNGNTASAFQIAGAGGVGKFDIEDSYGNLMPGGSAATGVAGANSIKVTGTVSVSQAAALDNASTATISVSLKDSYSAIFADATTRALASSIDINNATISASQAVTAYTWKTGATTAVSYNVASNASALATVLGAGGASAASITSDSAKTVTVTGAATVDQAGYLSEVSKIAYTISDNATNIQAALDNANGLNVADRETILGASSVTVTGYASIDQALGKAGSEDRGLYTLGSKVSFKIQDTGTNIAAALKGIDATGIYLATEISLKKVTAADYTMTVADAQAVTGLEKFVGADLDNNPLTAGVYSISDTFGNIQSGDSTVVSGALDLTANGVGTAPETIDFSAFGRGLTIDAKAGADFVFGSDYADVIFGGLGADVIDAGGGLDTVVLAAGDTVLTIGESGDNGTISGFDVVSNLAASDGTVLSETLNTVGTASVVANTTGANGTNSTLTIGGNAVASHAITNGIITFDDADTYAAALTIASAADVAAVVQYLQAQDLGSAGATVAFDVGADTYVYTQGSDEGTDNSLDVLVQLVDVQVTSLITTNATTANALFIA